MCKQIQPMLPTSSFYNVHTCG